MKPSVLLFVAVTTSSVAAERAGSVTIPANFQQEAARTFADGRKYFIWRTGKDILFERESIWIRPEPRTSPVFDFMFSAAQSTPEPWCLRMKLELKPASGGSPIQLQDVQCQLSDRLERFDPRHVDTQDDVSREASGRAVGQFWYVNPIVPGAGVITIELIGKPRSSYSSVEVKNFSSLSNALAIPVRIAPPAWWAQSALLVGLVSVAWFLIWVLMLPTGGRGPFVMPEDVGGTEKQYWR